MCIAFFLLQPESDLRLLIAFNRDEFLKRCAHVARSDTAHDACQTVSGGTMHSAFNTC